MDGLASKADVEGMQSAVIAQTKTLISEAVDPLKDEFGSMKNRVTALEQQRGMTTDTALLKKVADIEAQMARLTLQATPKDGTTAKVGGMQGASSADAAMEWLKGEMTKASIDGVLDVYH